MEHFNKLFHLFPTTLSLISTFRCTAACNNCCFECSPGQIGDIPLETAKKHIEYVINNCSSIKTVVITGGETFLDLGKTLELIREISKYNVISRVVTNGFWAKTKQQAIKIIEKCKNAGLNEINFSTGDDHLEYIPIENVQNGIYAAIKSKLVTVVNIESGRNRTFNKQVLLNGLEKYDDLDIEKVSIINGIWMPFTKEAITELQPINRDVFLPVMDRCKNLFTGITIDPNNHMLACCGLPVKYISFFDLGDLSTQNIQQAYVRQFEDFFKIWLFVEGPYKILSFLEEKIKKKIPELRVLSHMCFYCACLLTNPRYVKAARLFYREKYEYVMLKFFLLTNKNMLK